LQCARQTGHAHRAPSENDALGFPQREWTDGGGARVYLPLTIAEERIGGVAYTGPTTTGARCWPLFTRERYGFAMSVSGVAAIVEVAH
jgi:hypothetical protein